MTAYLSPEKHLSKIGKLPDDFVKLSETALIMGSITRPKVKLNAYYRHLDALGNGVEKYLRGLEDSLSVKYMQEALSEILYKKYGYIGSSCLSNNDTTSNLTFVIDQREGGPTALAILYMSVAQSQGWSVRGLNFPGRLLVRLEYDGYRTIIDPLSGGKELNTFNLREILKFTLGTQEELRASHLRELTHREILIRLQEEIIIHYLSINKIKEALHMIKLTLLFAPNGLGFLHKSGKIKNHVMNFEPTMVALREYLHENINMEEYPFEVSILSHLQINIE